ncbi:MAG: aldehyde dehydrogenase family protein [Microscillaceae bacterium]|jgi:aldehyde dehydrogenase (NAD+)|nr:aldehyde dehydrogenase family protein [Microscillaceae bacterium]
MENSILTAPDMKLVDQDVQRIFEAQKRNAQNIKNTTAKERVAKLKALKKLILEYREQIHQAVYADFRKSSAEADLGEIFGVLGSISHIVSHLRKWMKPKRVATPMNMLLTKGYVVYEPKGVCLIISPWNYPFQLAIDPLLYAIAAGNTAIIKPSEMTPHTSAVIKKMLAQLFKEDEIAVLEGDAQVAQTLLKKPFDHIFFTGSPMLGKVIMRAAAENLTSVTLELGGKSPTIVDQSANIKDAAEKIAWGKFFNCGQTCIAPDYVLVHENVKDQLISEMKNNIQKYYGQEAQKSDSYARIVNQRHFLRIKNLLDNAMQNGAEMEFGGNLDANENYISPTILSNVNDGMEVMHEEIFGPVLPIITFRSLKEATDYVNTKPKPLALYVFSKDKSVQNQVVNNTSAGGTAINETLAHISNPDLPFGGVNNSGIGKTHGFYGFAGFSNERAVLKQNIGWTTLKMLYPPYTDKKKKTINNFSKFV